MTLLSSANEEKVYRGLMRFWSRVDISLPVGFVKADLRQAVTDANVWQDAQQSAYNLALNAPFRGAATADQKALLLAVTILAVYDPALLKDLFQLGVD